MYLPLPNHSRDEAWAARKAAVDFTAEGCWGQKKNGLYAYPCRSAVGSARGSKGSTAQHLQMQELHHASESCRRWYESITCSREQQRRVGGAGNRSYVPYKRRTPSHNDFSVAGLGKKNAPKKGGPGGPWWFSGLKNVHDDDGIVYFLLRPPGEGERGRSECVTATHELLGGKASKQRTQDVRTKNSHRL